MEASPAAPLVLLGRHAVTPPWLHRPVLLANTALRHRLCAQCVLLGLRVPPKLLPQPRVLLARTVQRVPQHARLAVRAMCATKALQPLHGCQRHANQAIIVMERHRRNARYTHTTPSRVAQACHHAWRAQLATSAPLPQALSLMSIFARLGTTAQVAHPQCVLLDTTTPTKAQPLSRGACSVLWATTAPKAPPPPRCALLARTALRSRPGH